MPPTLERIPPSNEEIRDLLADQIDVQHKSVGMVIGIITPEGRRVVSRGGDAGSRRPLDRYVGEYQAATSPAFAVLRKGERLFIRIPYMATLPLRPESEHDFYVPELQFEFIFDWDSDGRVDEMLFGPRRGQPMLPLRRQ